MVTHVGQRALESPPHQLGSGPGDRVRERVVLGDDRIRDEDDEPTEGHRTSEAAPSGAQGLVTTPKFEKSDGGHMTPELCPN